MVEKSLSRSRDSLPSETQAGLLCLHRQTQMLNVTFLRTKERHSFSFFFLFICLFVYLFIYFY